MEKFLETLRKHLPSDWNVRVKGGRIEVREWAERPMPLFSFTMTHNTQAELLDCLPAIMAALVGQMYRDFCEAKNGALEIITTFDQVPVAVIVRISGTDGIEDAQFLAKRLREKLGDKAPLVIALDQGVDIEAFDEGQMREKGWVRADAVDLLS